MRSAGRQAIVPVDRTFPRFAVQRLVRKRESQQASGPVGRHGGRRAPVQPQDQQQSYRYIDHVDRGLQGRGRARPLPAEKVSKDHVVGQRGRSRPDADVAIELRILGHCGAGTKHPDSQRSHQGV